MWNIAAPGPLLLEMFQSRGKSTGAIVCACVCVGVCVCACVCVCVCVCVFLLFDVQYQESVLVRGSDSTISTWGTELP